MGWKDFFFNFFFPLSVWLDSKLVLDMVGGKCNGMERVFCPLGISLDFELVLDIVGGKGNGMERAACPLGGGNTCGNEEGMEGFGTV